MNPKGRRDRVDETPQRELQETEDDEDREADRHAVPEKLGARGATCRSSHASSPCPNRRANSVAAKARKPRFLPSRRFGKTRGHLCVDARRLGRHGEALFERGPRGYLCGANRCPALGPVDQPPPPALAVG